MTNWVFTIFDNMPKMFKRLKKETYEAYYNDFDLKNRHFFIEMLNNINASQEREKVAEALGNDFVIATKEHFKNKKNVITSANQINLNLFMIYYVFPLILKCEDENSNLLADEICKSWNITFSDNNISYTTYEEIYSNFRNKILGIF